MEKKSLMSGCNQSTEKALLIIELLASSQEPMRITDISTQLSMNKSTTLRFLASLQKFGYVMQESSGRYYLTYKICGIANQISIHNDLQTIAHPYLVALSNVIHETTCLSVEQDMTMVYVDVATGPDRMFMARQKIGNSSPMHCTGNGKLILSRYSEEMIDAYIAEKGLPVFTDKTIKTKEALLSELALVRKSGFAFDNEECEVGIRCVAYPIRNYTGEFIAGLSATGPIYRITDEKMQEIQAALKQTAQQISQILGFNN